MSEVPITFKPNKRLQEYLDRKGETDTKTDYNKLYHVL